MADGNRRVGVEVFASGGNSKEVFNGVKEDIKGVGQEAQKTSTATNAAMNGVGAAARGASGNTSQLLLRQQQLGQEMSRVNSAIKAESASLDLMQRVSARSADAAGLLNGKIVESQNALLGLLERKKATNSELEVLSRQLDKADGAFNKVTTRVSVGRGVLSGYDAAVEGLVRSMGGIDLGLAITLGLMSSLLPKIIELASGKAKIIELDEKQIALDVTAARAARDRADAEGRTAKITQDLNALLTEYGNRLASAITKANEESKATKDYAASKQFLSQAYKNLESDNERAVTRAAAEIARTEQLKQSTAALTGERQKADADLRKTTDSIIQFGIQTGRSNEQILEAARANGANSVVLQRLKDDLDSGRRAAIEFAIEAEKLAEALRKVEAPKLNLEFLRTQNQSINERINNAVELASTGFTLGPPTDIQLQAAIRPELEAVRKELRETAAGLAHNQAEATALYNVYLSQLLPLYRTWIEQLDRADHNMKAFADHTKEQEAAAKALATTTAQLASEQRASLLQTQIAIAQDKGDYERLYSLKNDLITENFRLKTEKLMLDKQATKENLVALAFMEMDAHKQLAIEQKRDNEERIKENDRMLKTFADGERAVAGEIFKIREKLLTDSQKSTLLWWKQHNQFQMAQIKEAVKLMDEVQRAFRQPLGIAIQKNKLEEIVLMMQKLNVDVRDVSQAFGFTASNVQVFTLQLKAIEAFKNKDVIGGISLSVKALAADIFSVANIATFVGNAIGNAFEAAISGTDSFGKSLTKAILNFIATIAQQFGSMFILIGSGLIWLGWPGGGALIGYGIALLALSGVLRGLANRLDNRQEQQQQASLASGGSSAASRGQDRQPRNNVVPFPTSGRSASNNSGSFTVSLDRQGTKDFLEGKKVLTMDDLNGGGNKSSQVKRRIQQFAKEVA